MVTQTDIARRAGVSTFTVSCALRGQGRVAAKTVERIRAQSEEMEYVPSSAGRALTAGRRRASGEVRDLSICVVRFGRVRRDASTIRENRRMVAKAREAGYALELVHFSDFESPRLMSRVLWARGVEGLLLLTGGAPAGFGMADLDGMDWDRFSVVKISRGIDALRCMNVRSSVFSQTKAALERIAAAGYQRIGVMMLSHSASEEDDFARLGAVRAFQFLRPTGVEVVDLFREETSITKLSLDAKIWLEKTKPDVVLGFPVTWRIWMEAAGYRIPSQFAFAGVPVVFAEESMSGVATSGALDDFIGLTFPAALNMLGEEIALGRRGLPSQPHEHVLPVIWQEGITMPPRRVE